MKSPHCIWSKLANVVIVLLCAAGVLGVAVWYLPVIHQNEKYRKEIVRLETKIQKEEERSRKLKTSIESLKHDAKAQERLARETFLFAKPGETVFRFGEAATNGVARR
jgi:cell division protein FtsB